MKIRYDFVSNSSSSSFMLVGHAFNDEEIALIAEKNGIKSNYIYELESKFNLTYHRGIDNYYDLHCFGLSYDDMKANETKTEFENRIAEMLKQMTRTDCKVETIVDGGYDS